MRVFLNSSELAERWKMTEQTLINKRSKGEGVAYHRIMNKILYDLADIVAYENEQRIEAKKAS